MQFRRRLAPINQINLIPMIDISFQLVFFFMVTSTFVITPGIRLLLPHSSTAEPVVMTRLVVTVVSPNEIYLNKEKYDVASLDTHLAALSKKDRESIQSVVLEGDKSISYDLMVQVLDDLRKNGFTGVNLKLLQTQPGQ
ncbi:MAG TPA: biopolymer transporter ExbD [Spirochaetia bacterium]|nr:biopolymer transporter ExbD [Spirochaetia bacterium]